MATWTWLGLRLGSATTRWPRPDGDDGQSGLLGMPRFHPQHCKSACRECVDVCPTAAITQAPSDSDTNILIDYGRCVVCQLCTEVCPSGALSPSEDWAFGTPERTDLQWRKATDSAAGQRLKARIAMFRRSLHIRHVDAGSCNGCESELQALNNPFYNLHRLGIFFTPSPRFADLLLVTGPVTAPMREPLLNTYQAMPEPRLVMATGTCAVSGGISGDGYNTGRGLDGVLPVNLYLPGCPPNPAAVIEGLLVLLERMPARVKGGRLER
ncbi:MAG: 4Fe-4S binding protein [Gammaproteobacteria bacterium]